LLKPFFMNRKDIVLFCLIFLGSFTSYGQSLYSGITCPPNIDFEFGDLSFWHFQNGLCAYTGGPPKLTMTPTAPIFGRESLTAGTGVDLYGGFPIVDPGGGSYALKLGRDTPLYCTEQADYFVHIPAGINNYSIVYRYAVVLQNGGHGPFSQPRFRVNAFDSATGIPTPCAQYEYVVNSDPTKVLPGFFTSPLSTLVICKNWSTVSVNLSGLSGHTIDMQVQSIDCTAGGHWGYGYIDLSCGLFAIDSKICDDTLATLTGPSGFQSYQWTDSLTFLKKLGTTQVITMPIPDTATTFAVIIAPFVGFGCPDTLYTRVMPSYLKIHPSNDTLVCTSTPVSIAANATDSLLDLPLKYTWAPGTSISCTACANPVASPSVTTVYTVTVTDKAGCQKTAKITVATDKVTNTISKVNDSCYAAKNGSATVNPVTGVPPYNYIWSTLPVQTGKTAVGLVKGTYSVTVTDNIGCSGTASTTLTEPPANNLSIVSSSGPTTCLGSDGYIVLSGLISGTSYTINYNYNGLPAAPQVQVATGLGTDSLTKLRSGLYDNITIDVTKLSRPYCPFNTQQRPYMFRGYAEAFCDGCC